MASVTLSDVWRARYSFSASLNKRLRDLLVLRARRSAPLKRSSGMDTAVLMLLGQARGFCLLRRIAVPPLFRMSGIKAEVYNFAVLRVRQRSNGADRGAIYSDRAR